MKQKVYISLFAILYLIVAFSSFWHAVSFFGLANNNWMSIILAFAFEVGQAAVLFSLLTSSKDRSRIMPWVLMTMFTLVQVIGNVFSSYKYIITNSVENLRYFKEPIFIWTTIPDDQATVIIVYLVGALLPIASLLLTSMITNYLTDQEELKKDKNTEIINNDKEEDKDNSKEDLEKHNDDTILPQEEVILSKDNDSKQIFPNDEDYAYYDGYIKKEREIEELKKQLEEAERKNKEYLENPFKEENEQREEKLDNNNEQQSVETTGDHGEAESIIQDESVKNETTIDSSDDTEKNEKNNEKRKSHFINLNR
jgi:hypothetical protein